jgi:hypothetical protein
MEPIYSPVTGTMPLLGDSSIDSITHKSGLASKAPKVTSRQAKCNKRARSDKIVPFITNLTVSSSGVNLKTNMAYLPGQTGQPIKTRHYKDKNGNCKNFTTQRP